MRNSIIVIHQQWPEFEKIGIIDSSCNGTADVRNWHGDKESWIFSLYVDEAHRQQGIATQILDEAERYAEYRPIHVCVDHNAPQWLIDFYKERGYEVHDEE